MNLTDIDFSLGWIGLPDYLYYEMTNTDLETIRQSVRNNLLEECRSLMLMINDLGTEIRKHPTQATMIDAKIQTMCRHRETYLGFLENDATKCVPMSLMERERF